MSYKRNMSNYIDDVNVQAARIGVNTRVSPIVFLLSVFSAAFIMLLAIQPVLIGLSNKNSGTSANAAGFFCSEIMGAGMDGRSPWDQSMKDYPLPDKTGRTWTLQEALSAGIGVVNYSGEGEGGNWLISDKETPTGKEYKEHAAQYSDKLEAERNLGGCAIGTLLGSIANLGLMTADLIAGVAQFFAVKAFDTELICPDPSNPDGSCLNIGKMIGGTGSQTGGIIGALTASVYTPLLVIAVAIAAGWVLYIGLMKRRVREALIGAIWVLLSVILGLAFLLNPSLLVKAPISLSNAVSTCVIGAFNGENCFTSGSTGNGIQNEVNSSKNICRSDVNGASIPESMMLTTNAITCSIWKAFVLEPYAQISFGMSFEDLDTQKGAINSAVTEAGLQGNEFCVDLKSSKSYNQMTGRRLELNGGNKVCNLLAYQMMLKVNVQSGSEKLPVNGTMDDRWYKVVAVAAANDGVWSHWSGNSTSGINQIMLSLLAVITSALGSFIIIVTSIFALVYYVSTVILMAFAPVFLLIGIHPGRGKKIMLGWVEKVVSNLLKYFVSAVFLVVTLVIYGGILGSATNMGLILMFVIIVTMALFMYRQELMNLLGRANMGGEQLSGALSTSLGNMAQNAGRSGKNLAKLGSGTVTAAVGSGAGAFLASGGVSIGERLQNTKSGLKDGGKRHLSRQGGLVGNIARQYERSSVDNQRDLHKKVQSAQQEYIDYGNDVVREEKAFDESESKLSNAAAAVETDKNKLTNLNENMQEFRTAENETLKDMRTDSTAKSEQRISTLDREIDEIAANSSLSAEEKRAKTEQKEAEIARIEQSNRIVLDFANYQGLLNEIQEAKMNFNHAKAMGDQNAMDNYQGIIDSKSAERDELYDNIGSKNVSILSRRYAGDLQDHLNKHGIQSFSNEDFSEYQDLRLKVATSEESLSDLEIQRDIAKLNYELSQAQEKRSKMTFEKYESTLRDLKPGESLQQEDLDRMYEDLGFDLEDEDLSDHHIDGMKAKIEELKASSGEYTMPHLDKVDGRFNQFVDVSMDDKDVPLVDNNTNDNVPEFAPVQQNSERVSDSQPVPYSGSGVPESNATDYGSKVLPDDNDVPFDPEYDTVVPVSIPQNTPQNASESRDRVNRSQANSMPLNGRTIVPEDNVPPMPTPVDPNAGSYLEPDERFIPPADNEVLPVDPKTDRKRHLPTRPAAPRQEQQFTAPVQRETQAQQFNNTEMNNERIEEPENVQESYEQTTATPVTPERKAPSPNQSRGNSRRPTNKIPPPPYAPDKPMPTPADPNEGNYFVDDREIPVAEDEVLPRDNKQDRKQYVNKERNTPSASARKPVQETRRQASSMFDNLSKEDEILADEYLKQQQELLMDDEEEMLHFAKNEKQEQVRDRFVKGAQEDRAKNEALRNIRRPKRSLPTSPNKNKDEE